MAGYIGSKVAVVSSGAERKKVFTATSGQTSFTGLSYTVNNVHVFQNGVRLVDGTDYTATNGNSITLTVGAATDDQVVVVSYNTFQTSDTVSASTGGTFAGDVNFTGAFTSQGIDDNATSTAMTLDASGNLLVGKTTTAIGTAGSRLISNGQIQATASGQEPYFANRLSSDGVLFDFRKDGTTVGRIGVNSGTRIYIGSGDANLTFNPVGNYVFPSTSTGGARDAQLDLGLSAARFKDLYLSGGVFLGGTGSANKLDDYEEGTWTPAVSATSSAPSSISYSERTGIYTKIGNLVTLQCELRISSKSGGSGGATITGMPFACKSVDIVPVGSMEASFINLSTGYSMFAVMTYQSQSAIFLRQHGDSVTESSISIGSVGSSSRIRFTLTYQTQ